MRDLKVLVVDDSEINQLLICKILETQGSSTEVAFNGKEAVDKFREMNFDLVFMDIQMPEMDGYQATGLIRQLETGKNVKIIAVTAHAMPEDEVKCLQAGMDQYITKPVQPQVIIDLVNKLFSGERGDNTKAQDPQSDHIQALYQKIHGELTFLRELTTKFSESYYDLMPKIKLALRQEDFQALKTHTHTLKGLLAALEAVDALVIMDKIERGVQGKSADNVLTQLGKLETSVSQFINDIDIFIDSKTYATRRLSGDENDKSINN